MKLSMLKALDSSKNYVEVNLRTELLELGMVVQACNSSTQETGTEWFQDQGQPGLHKESLQLSHFKMVWQSGLVEPIYFLSDPLMSAYIVRCVFCSCKGELTLFSDIVWGSSPLLLDVREAGLLVLKLCEDIKWFTHDYIVPIFFSIEKVKSFT